CARGGYYGSSSFAYW
nr:immunoglobulin heavy chain junction region [Mus musculus]NSM04889.1 immunoglobulin heavy chain junction region [Mus musculus]NSM05806.1 immunoglobulin heavy chain junction region [Mus musculus]NSM06046.1 immunoglobulin heavy chain junction region [Mus musculus]NSM07134.1 immunoglobulin heavy chain junction region [Mus musculus]